MKLGEATPEEADTVELSRWARDPGAISKRR